MRPSIRFIQIFITFVFGITVGSLGLGIATAEETPLPVATTTVPQGEILDICIAKKTGIIRAVSTCKKTERKTTLGGVGPKGDKGATGATGATGAQGERGFTGATGAMGAISGLRTAEIDFLSAGVFGCPGFGSSKTVLTSVSLSSWLSTTPSLYSSKTTLNGCSATVTCR